MKIPIYHWGGEPIRLHSSTPELNSSDSEVFRNLAKQLSDPANTQEKWIPWLTDGSVWMESPSRDGQRRLLLRPFYVPIQGQRSQWSFCGFAFSPNTGSTALWAATILKLLEIREEDLHGCDGVLTITDVSPWPVATECAPPQGKIFQGSRTDAIRRLCNSIARCDWNDIADLHVASHPPVSFPHVTTLLLSDEFPLKNIRLIHDKPSNAEDKATRAPSGFSGKLPKFLGDYRQGNTNQDQQKKPRTFYWMLAGGLLLCTLVGTGMIWQSHQSLSQHASTVQKNTLPPPKQLHAPPEIRRHDETRDTSQILPSNVTKPSQTVDDPQQRLELLDEEARMPASRN